MTNEDKKFTSVKPRVGKFDLLCSLRLQNVFRM